MIFHFATKLSNNNIILYADASFASHISFPETSVNLLISDPDLAIYNPYSMLIEMCESIISKHVVSQVYHVT